MSDGLALGIDLGTSAVKVLAVDHAGVCVGEAQCGFPTVSDAPLKAEQTPQQWLEAVGAAMRDLHRHLTATRRGAAAEVRAIGLTGQLPTLVCLGNDGPIAPAITWRDGRADESAARIGPGRRREIYQRTGMPIDGRYLAPMVAHHFRDRMSDIRSVLSAKDFLGWSLTGLALTEPSTAAGYGVFDLEEGRFSEPLARDWQLPMDRLPPVRPSNELAGPLDARAAQRLGLPSGVPVSTGAADSVSAAYALAGLQERCASLSLGTSAVLIAATNRLSLDPTARCLVTPHVRAGWYGREMDLLASGSGHRWLSQLFGWADGELDARAARSPPGARGLSFPPYLAGGEQGALWNPKLKAGVIGLGLEHGADDIARAYLEGVSFELRRCVDVLAEQTSIDAVAVSGSLTRVPSSAQMLADVLGRPLKLATRKSPAAYGAAALAHALSGAKVELEASSLPELAPGPAAQLYDSLYERYRERSALCA